MAEVDEGSPVIFLLHRVHAEYLGKTTSVEVRIQAVPCVMRDSDAATGDQRRALGGL